MAVFSLFGSYRRYKRCTVNGGAYGIVFQATTGRQIVHKHSLTPSEQKDFNIALSEDGSRWHDRRSPGTQVDRIEIDDTNLTKPTNAKISFDPSQTANGSDG